jgi:8-amino-7-oxononanoate synthase
VSVRKKGLADVVDDALPFIDDAIARGLMQTTITARDKKRVTLKDGRVVTEFINCSYLALDRHPDVVRAAKDVLDQWGVHFCCARSRFTIGPNTVLEEGLSRLFRGHAITFPSVTSAHMSTLPLLASGVLLNTRRHDRVRMVFDRFAHASMQSLKPILAESASVTSIPHNDLAALARELDDAERAGEDVVFVADSVYSMGGTCPLPEVLALTRAHGASLYIDDAHGTSIFGEKGEGQLLAVIEGPLPDDVIFTFSLAKGYGTNGGGVVVPTDRQRKLIRSFGSTAAFSAPLDFSIVAAAEVVLAMHESGHVRALQQTLVERVALFDSLRGIVEPMSPIRMVPLATRAQALDVGEALVARGYFVTVALYPVVPKDRPQLRVCITVEHSEDDIRGLARALAELGV